MQTYAPGVLESLPHSTPAAAQAPVVFVVDDDLAVRESLEMLIGGAGWQVRTFARVDEFLVHPRNPVPACLVLEASFPGVESLELQRRLAANECSLPIVFISEQIDVRMTVQAMKAGAVDVLMKPLSESALMGAVGDALDLSRGALVHEAELRTLRERHASLTAREREVLVLVAAGLLNKQAGAELGISEITVKAHRGQVMRKMKARSLPELVRISATLGLARA